MSTINLDKADSLGSNDEDASESDGSADFALPRRNQDEASFERYPHRDVVGSPESEWSELLRDKFLFLLRTGCDPAAEDDDGLTVCNYAKIHNLNTTWHAALSTFNAERQGVATNG